MALGLVMASTCPASAAPVQLQVGECVLETTAENRAELEQLAARAEVILPRLQADLGVRSAAPYRIVLIPAHPIRDSRIARLDALAPVWAAGFLLPSQRVGGIRITEAARYPHSNLASVLVHEVTHMLLHDASLGELPRWFSEGVATLEDRRWGVRDVLVYTGAMFARELPKLEEIDTAFTTSPSGARMAYAASFDFVSWSERRYGPGFIRRLVGELSGKPFWVAWEVASGVSLPESEAQWRRGTVFFYRWLPLLTSTTTLWIGITALALLAGLRRRARSRALYAEWEAQERDRHRDSAGPDVN